jgi:ketosteroid isomerase-like protein
VKSWNHRFQTREQAWRVDRVSVRVLEWVFLVGDELKEGDMRRYVWLLVAAVVLSVGCGSSVNVDQQRNALLALDREWSQTTTDLNKFLSYYAADASVYPQGMPIATGSEAIRDTMTKMTSMPGFSLQWSATKADVSASGDLGYTTGTYQMAMNNGAGTPTTEKGKYVTVWKKQSNGQWKVADDIFNADAPPPPPAPAVAPKSKRAPARSTSKRSTPRKRG